MLTSTNRTNQAWRSDGRQMEIKIRINGVTYGNGEINSVLFDSGSISGESFQIGSTYSNKIDISFPSVIETLEERGEVTAELGVLVKGIDDEEDVYEYSKLGSFFINELDRDRNSNVTTVSAVDKMIFMNGLYESKLAYPATIRDVALEIANSAEVEIDPLSYATLSTQAIGELKGYTHRQAIGIIAQFEGGFANFNRDGRLQIRGLALNDFSIPMSDYLLKGFRKNEKTYRINGIRVKTGNEESDVLTIGSDKGNVVELENAVMTQPLLNNIWNKVKDISYYPFELKWRGNPNLEAGDWINITDRDGISYPVPNLSYSLSYNGGLTAESKASTVGNSEVTYTYKGTLSQQVEEIKGVLLGANGWNHNWYGDAEPQNPKEGDLWFKKNGQYTEIWKYTNVDGVLKWVIEISNAPDEAMKVAIQQAQQSADEAKAAGERAELSGQAALALGQEALAAGQVAQQQAHQAELTGQAAQQKADQAEITGQQAEAVGQAAQQKADQADADAKQALSELEDVRDDIDFTVKKDEIIGQINLQAGKTIFRQNDNVVMITPETTYISDGTIKTAHIALANITSALIKDLAVTDAKIASLTASKLTAGTIDANIITVTNLNASLITTGQMDVARLKVADLRVGTANILDLNVTEGKIANLAVSSAKIKDLAVTTAKIGDAAIVTAKIGNLAVTGAKIADATISSAKIISLDAYKITAQTLSAITANTGDLNVSGNLTMLTPNNLITGVFDYGDPVGGAHNPRYFKNGYMAIGQQNIAYTADIHELTSSGTAGAFKYYGDAYVGPDTLKLRNYTYKDGPVQGTTSIYAGQMVLANDFEGINNGITLNGITGRVWSRGAVTCSTIEPNIFTGSFQINSGYTNNIAKLHLAAGATGASFNWGNKQGYADFFAGKDNTAVIWSNSVYPRTYSQSANMVINTDGSFGRATSASKYKLNISEIENVGELAYNLLTIRPKRWNDKKETEEIANELSSGENEVRDTLYLRQYHGLIAEDLRAAGLDAYISYDNKTGEIEGIEYDKLWTLLIPIVKKQQEDILDLKLTLGVA